MGGGGEWRKYLVRLVSRQRKLQVQSETVSFSGWNYDEQRGEVFQALFHPPQRKRENIKGNLFPSPSLGRRGIWNVLNRKLIVIMQTY